MSPNNKDPLVLVPSKDIDRNKALASALAQIDKAFGKGAVMRLGERSGVTDVRVIPTG